MYCIWRVDDVRDGFKTVNEAISQAVHTIENTDRDTVLVMKVVRRVKRKIPRVQVIVERLD